MAKPMSKPVKKFKRFAEGDLVKGTTNVRTRSDDEIGDTDPRTRVYTPGSFDKNRAAGEANLNAVKGLFGRLTGGSKDSSESSSTASTSKPSSGGLRGNFSSASSGASGDDTGKPSGSPLKGVSTKQSNTESAAEDKSESTDSGSTSSSEYKPTLDLSKSLHTPKYDYEAPKDKKKFVADKPADKKKAVVEKKPVKDTSNYSNEARKGSGPPPAKIETKSTKPESKPEKKGIGPYNAFSGVSDYLRKTFTAEGRDEVRKENKKKSGGAVKMASGGMTASRRGDGIAQRGKTRGKMC
jgi:hypothetical protein